MRADLEVAGPHGPIPVRVYEPDGPAEAVLVWAHGGGFRHGDLDMPDQVKAKIHKAAGRAGVANGEPAAETILAFKRALELDKNVGVKKDIEQLERAIKKAAEQAEPDA